MRVEAPRASYDNFLEAARGFWSQHVPEGSSSSTAPSLLVEAMSVHPHVALRSLSFAGALRAQQPGPIVVLAGVDADYQAALWQDYDINAVVELAGAYGADVVDLHAIANRLVADPHRPVEVAVADRRVVCGPIDTAPEAEVLAAARSTWCRVNQSPSPYASATAPDFDLRVRRAQALSAAWSALIRDLTASALVTSHVDYDQWGLGVLAALRARVPVIHVQSTGGLKAYAVHPDSLDRRRWHMPGQARGAPVALHAAHGPTFRSVLTLEIAELFRAQVWPQRELLNRSCVCRPCDCGD